MRILISFILGTLISGTSLIASELTNDDIADESITIEAQCRFTVVKKSGKVFVYNGVVRSLTGRDYLTLEPTTSADIGFSARILLTENYYPVSIHPRGDTVYTVKHGDLFQKSPIELSFEEDGSSYSLFCELRTI